MKKIIQGLVHCMHWHWVWPSWSDSVTKCQTQIVYLYDTLSVCRNLDTLPEGWIGLLSVLIYWLTRYCPGSSTHDTFYKWQCWLIVGPPSATLAQHQTSIGSTCRVCWVRAVSSASGSGESEWVSVRQWAKLVSARPLDRLYSFV